MLRKLFLISTLLIIFWYNSKDNNDDVIINEVVYENNSAYNEKVCKSILIIEKINLNKCMNYNDVDKDIAVLYDDKTIVLAGHSGNATNAYFRYLYKLEIGDEVVFYHNSVKNNYRVKNIKTKLKKDKLVFDNIDDQLIMITCSYTNKNEQIVYILSKNA